MPDFEKFKKTTKKEYEDAFKEVCDDLIKGRYDNWIIEGEFIFHKEFPCWHKKPEIFAAFDCTGELDISRCYYSDPERGNMPLGDFLNDLYIENLHGDGDCDLEIHKLTNTPYNKLLKVLHPIWIDENIPELKKPEELEKAFNRVLYGEETDQPVSGKAGLESILPAPEGTKWEEIKIRITKETQISLTVKGKERTYSMKKFIEIIKLPTYLKDLFWEIVLSPTSIIEEKGKKNFKQNISALRRVLKDAFGITDDPIPSHEAKTYKAKFLTQSDLGKSSSTNNDLSP